MNTLYIAGLLTGLGVGLALAFIITFLVVKYDLHHQLLRVQRGRKLVPMLMVAALAAVLFGAQLHGVRADTPVPLTIPTAEIFTSANDWITTFAPIAAIGIGISIALAVLGYLGKMIVSAFRA